MAGPYVWVATVWKSAACRAGNVLKKPFFISIRKPWKMATGLPPPTIRANASKLRVGRNQKGA